METAAGEEKVIIDFSNPPLSYSYDENGIFTQTETCSPDPLESEIKGEAVWLIPANATIIEPPAAVEKYVRVFKNGAWEQVEDNRGTKYWLPGDNWQTEPREMNGLGPLPEDALLEAPAKTDEELAAEELVQAKAERADAVSKIVVTVDDMVFDGDEISQERMSRTITAAVATGEDMSATTTWVLADNTVAQVSITQLAQALRAAGEAQTDLWTMPYEDTPEEPTTEPETVPDDTTTQPKQTADTEATA